MKRLLSRDPLTGTETYFHYDEMTKKVGYETKTDITEVIEHNKAIQNETLDKRGDMWPVATVPLCILHQWSIESGIAMNTKEFGEVVKKKLNDPDNRLFRTQVFNL